MPKFRKRPVVVEAIQWFPPTDARHKTIEGVKDVYWTYPSGTKEYKNTYIDTLEGAMTVSPGDWVITGVQGEKYPCKPDIFEKTYEAVNE